LLSPGIFSFYAFASALFAFQFARCFLEILALTAALILRFVLPDALDFDIPPS